ncbi:hypothetical protein BDB01DRAFT_796686 [Pilobolus umbonatus]|nr:hypothetical protein BDB01DRAFT_828952 [Pilobolus umbonatus]KAI8980512.1 hypothetical protein BDB01DRAFT_796686 [Pilobolus umbonatus]
MYWTIYCIPNKHFIYPSHIICVTSTYIQCISYTSLTHSSLTMATTLPHWYIYCTLNKHFI